MLFLYSAICMNVKARHNVLINCSIPICIYWLLCLKSLILKTNASHFLHISLEQESSSVIWMPQVAFTFAHISLSLPLLPNIRNIWRLSLEQPQSRQIELRAVIFLGVDTSILMILSAILVAKKKTTIRQKLLYVAANWSYNWHKTLHN